MAQKHRYTAGIEIASEHISLAYLDHSSSTIGSVAVFPLQHSAFSDWKKTQSDFTRLYKQARDRKTRHGTCSLPSQEAVLLTVGLESNTESDLQQALKWELEQNIVGSLQDYAYSWDAQGGASNAEQKTQWLLCAFRKLRVNQVLELFAQARLHPLAVEIDILALINVFSVNYPEQSQSPVVLVLSNEDCTKVVVSKQGRYIRSSLLHAAIYEKGPAQFAEKLADTIDRLTNVSQLQSPVPVYYTGSMFAQNEFCDELNQKVPQSNILLPFRKIGSPNISEEDLLTYAPMLAVAVGLALRGKA